MTAEVAAPPRCPLSRSFSYATGQYSVSLDYAGLTALMDATFDAWDAAEADGITLETGNLFESLINRIAELRQWTGWDGVPMEYRK